MVAMSDHPPTVHWGCVSCEDDGLISGWKGTACDLSPDPAAEEVTLAGVVSEGCYRALLGCLFLDRVCDRVVHSAEPVREGIELCATEDGWEEFRDAVAPKPITRLVHARDGSTRRCGNSMRRSSSPDDGPGRNQGPGRCTGHPGTHPPGCRNAPWPS